MPNPGGICLGCGTCRSRKIKCDRGLPECERCVKYGLPCPGYPLEQDIRFRDETRKTVQKVILPLVDLSSGDRANLVQAKEPGTSKETLQIFSRKIENPLQKRGGEQDATRQPASLLQWITDSTSLPRLLTLPRDTILTSYFFDQLLMPIGWYSYLPQLYQRSPRGGCLRLTVSAASMFLAANQFDDTRLAFQARHIYGSVLQAMNTVLADPEKRLQDETLCSILMLNILDDITGQKSFVDGTHLKGCAQLLKLRHDCGVWTPCTPDLAHSVVIQTQAQVVQSYDPNCEASEEWLGAQTWQRHAAMVYRWCVEIGRLSEVASSLLSSNSWLQSDLETALLGVIETARRLESSMQNWYICGGPRWSYQSTELPSPVGEQTTADYYADVQVAKVWNQYRAARIILHRIILDAAGRLQVLKTEPRCESGILAAISQESESIVTSMLTGICDSIPFHLQRIDSVGRQCSSQSQQVLGGCALIWPLDTVLRCRWSKVVHRHLAAQALTEVGQTVGVGQALVSLARSEEEANDMTVAAA